MRRCLWIQRKSGLPSLNLRAPFLIVPAEGDNFLYHMGIVENLRDTRHANAPGIP